MSYADLPDEVRKIAARELTDKQLEAFVYECSGLGFLTIGRLLDISKQSVAARIDGAHRKLRKAGVRQDASGEWYIETGVAV